MRLNIKNSLNWKFFRKINFTAFKSIFFVSSLLYFFVYFFYNIDQISFDINLEKNGINLFLSIDKGETATGSGFKLPLVMSTSIKLNDFIGKNKISTINKKNFILLIFNLQAFLLHQNLIVTLSTFHIQCLVLLKVDII